MFVVLVVQLHALAIIIFVVIAVVVILHFLIYRSEMSVDMRFYVFCCFCYSLYEKKNKQNETSVQFVVNLHYPEICDKLIRIYCLLLLLMLQTIKKKTTNFSHRTLNVFDCI